MGNTSRIRHRRAVIIKPEYFIKIMSAKPENYFEHQLKASHAIAWCGVYPSDIIFFNLKQLDFRFGILWNGKPYPIKPESRQAIEEWLDVRVQKGNEQLYLTTSRGVGIKNRRLFSGVGYKEMSKWIGCPLLLSDTYTSWQVHYCKANLHLLERELNEYINNKSDLLLDSIKQFYQYVDEPPCVQYHLYRKQISDRQKRKGIK